MEQEFYKSNLVTYFPLWPVPVVTVSGTLTVTDQKIYQRNLSGTVL